MGIRRNAAADSAAKDAIVGDISVELIPFSDLKSCTICLIFLLELWQSEWDEFPENKLYKIFPKLKESKHLFSAKQKRKECDSPIARYSFFYYSLLFIEGSGTTSVYRM